MRMSEAFVSNERTESISSVELSKNSKGVTWKIKVYNVDVDQAFKDANRLHEECIKKYKNEVF